MQLNRRGFLGLGVKGLVLGAALSTGLASTELGLIKRPEVKLTVFRDIPFDAVGVRADFERENSTHHFLVKFADSSKTDSKVISEAMPYISGWQDRILSEAL